MARVFAYLMQPEAKMTDEAIFSDTSSIIKKALVDAHAKNSNKIGIAKNAFGIALSKLV
jgi:hypothetical protein